MVEHRNTNIETTYLFGLAKPSLESLTRFEI